jgi:small subunit ribosomal protein S31
LLDKTSPIWEKYEQDELTRISSIPPRNAFEEMIQWTKDGILWKFPIDNEQGEWIRYRII